MALGNFNATSEAFDKSKTISKASENLSTEDGTSTHSPLFRLPLSLIPRFILYKTKIGVLLSKANKEVWKLRQSS